MYQVRGFYLLVLLLVFAPLVNGGNRPIPLLILEFTALAIAGYLVASSQKLSRIPRLYIAVVAGIFLLPLLHLIQLPFSFWAMLPGHATYAQALADVSTNLNGSARAASIDPSLTEYAWLAVLPPIMVFLFTLNVPKEQLKTAVMVFLGMAAFQAILGLMQYGAGPDSLLQFNDSPHKAYALGTYANRDHLAGFLEMALPLSLAMLSVSVGHTHSARRHTRNLRQRLVFLTSTYLNQTAVYASISIAILLGLIFTHSRTGNALAMLVIFLSTVMFSTRIGGRNVYGVIGTFAAIALMLAVEVGMAPVLNRFIQQDPLQDGRWMIFNSTIKAIGEFFPLGSGMGTFNQVFPRFQDFSFNGAFVNRAHNDYLEWLMEGGIFAGVLIVIFLALYAGRWTKVLKRGEWRTFNFMQIGAGIGLFAMMLHTFVDFNLHIPANQIYFAFLAALFFYQSDNEPETQPLQSIPDVKKAPTSDAAPVQEEKKSYIVKSTNPFAD